MRYVKIFALVILLWGGCRGKSLLPPCWLGESTNEFEGKTMIAMVWLRPKGDKMEQWEVYKRFDECDFQVLLDCLKEPEVSWPLRRDLTEECLYLSFLDGTRYLVTFRLEICNGYVLLPHGASKRLYALLMEKGTCSSTKLQEELLMRIQSDPEKFYPQKNP